MSLILRWFHDDGERHRAYYRERDDTGERELVIAGRDWQHAEPAPQEPPLEELSEDALLDLARSWRSRGRIRY